MRIAVVCLLACAAGTGQASAQAPASLQLDPNSAGHGTRLTLEARPGDSGTATQGVRAVVLDAPDGLTLDRRARAARCTPSQASSFKCPAASRIGFGEVEGHASGPFLPVGGYGFTAAVEVSLAPPPQTGDVAGAVLVVRERSSGQKGTVTGRVVRSAGAPFGLELRFDDLDRVIPSFPDVSLSIDHVQLKAGASRTVVRKRTVRRHGRRVTVRSRHHYDLLTNPPTCSEGSWPFRLTIVYADRSDPRDATVPCAAR
jgi:hypothetical protein